MNYNKGSLDRTDNLSTNISNYEYIFQAGNVVTGEMVEELILSGADIIKVCILFLYTSKPTKEVETDKKQFFSALQ